jgi:hypothetical protein
MPPAATTHQTPRVTSSDDSGLLAPRPLCPDNPDPLLSPRFRRLKSLHPTSDNSIRIRPAQSPTPQPPSPRVRRFDPLLPATDASTQFRSLLLRLVPPSPVFSLPTPLHPSALPISDYSSQVRPQRPAPDSPTLFRSPHVRLLVLWPGRPTPDYSIRFRSAQPRRATSIPLISTLIRLVTTPHFFPHLPSTPHPTSCLPISDPSLRLLSGLSRLLTPIPP